MKKRIFFIYILVIHCSNLFAQYDGGNGDGYSELTKAETTINNTEIGLLYIGSSGDGYSDKLLANTTLNNTNLSQLYFGGNGDGHDISIKNETNLTNLSLVQIYSGSDGDGYSDDLLAETNLTNLSLIQLYSGNIGDGYAQNLFSETTLNNLDLTLLYAGSNGDGYAQNLFSETTLNNLSLSLLYSGSDGDGYADSLLSSATLSNLSLSIIFGGGDGDGYSRGEYFQNSLCNRVITVWNAGVWSNGAPNNTMQTVIDDTYDTSILGNLDLCSCTVRTGASLFVRSNNYVRVVNDIVNNGDFDILHQGSLVQNNNNATVTGSGTFTTRIESTTLVDQDRFTFFSSPVESQDLTVFNSFANMARLWRFNESTQDWYQVTSATNMIPAVGYAIQGAPDVGQYPLIGTANFNGPFNNGIFSYPLTYNAGGLDDDNSLVGNPYPSAVNATLLLSNNANANAFYFWSHNSVLLADGSDYADDDYTVWNNSGGIASSSGTPAPSGFIASGQGFFVDAIGPGNLVFNNTYRVTGNNSNFFRNEETDIRDRIWLNLTNENGLFSQILVNFSDDGSFEFDSKYDAIRYYTENPISFYSNGLNEEKFAIQALPVLTEDNIVPLGIEIINASINQLKISIDHLENFNDVEIYLKDNLLNIVHDLETEDYVFSIDEIGNINFRFELIFNRNALNTKENLLVSESLIVSNYSEHSIKVRTKNNRIIKVFKAYDVLGKLIVDIKPSQNNFIIPTNINQGTVLFIKAKLENGTILKTKFIKL